MLYLEDIRFIEGSWFYWQGNRARDIVVAGHDVTFIHEWSLIPNCAPEKSWQTCSLAQF